MQVESESPELEPHDIPEIVSGLRIRQMTPFGNMHVKITVDPRTGRDLEVFAQLGKGGDVANSDLEAICRLISLWLRAGGTLKHVIRQLKDIGSSLQVPTREGKIMSLGDGLSRRCCVTGGPRRASGCGPCCWASAICPNWTPGRRRQRQRPWQRERPRPNGNGNGNGKDHEHVSEVRHAKTAHGGIAEGAPAELGPTQASPAGPGTPRFELVNAPNAGESLAFAEGCNKCYNCGWAQC